MQLLSTVFVIPTWVSLVMAVVLLLLLLWIGYTRAPGISGFGPHVVKKTETFEFDAEEARKRAPEEEGPPEKLSITTETQSARTVWEWLTVLTISAVITGVALWFSNSQAEQQREIENLRSERAVVDSHLEHIGILLLEEDLRTAGENGDVRLLARARTLAALDGVSGDRKVRLLEFLSETNLIQFGPQGEPPVISLRFADLRDTHLVKRHILINTDLDRAELDNAQLDDAKLNNAKLTRATLTGADLSGTDLSGADLTGADLSNAQGVSCQQMQGAESLEDATMPNGQKYEDWLKSKGCREDGENSGS
jgi:uncharacterized protein YjbI with pentapeptide repeats